MVKSAQQKKRIKKNLANQLVFHGYIYNSAALQCLSANELKNTLFCVPKFIGTNGVRIPGLFKTSFSTEKIKIVYIGRLEVKPKGLDLLLQALSLIKTETDCLNQISSIDLYGPDYNGRYNEVLSLIVQNGLDGIVSLHHELMGEKKQCCLLDSDIFIQTSRHEGMPMGILEAMSFGIPCLITKGTSLGEITEKYNAGWVSETTVESIAETLIRVIQERNFIPEKSSNARKLIVDNFAWSQIAKNTINSYVSYLYNNH